MPEPAPPLLAAVRLELDSRAESLSVVRAMLSGVAGAVAMERDRFDDMRTAVSEACNNVVLHAYDTPPGPMLVELDLEPTRLQVRVCDHGRGIRRIISPGDRMRVGLALISALADRAEVLGRDGGGTEVRMLFPGMGTSSATAAPLPDAALDMLRGRDAGEADVVAAVAPVALVDGVLGRVADAVAVRARFTVDRHADLQLVCDELGALVRSAGGPAAVVMSATVAPRRLELRLGPVPAGTLERFRAARAEGAGSPVEALSDELGATVHDGFETVVLVLADRRAPVAA